MQCFSERNGAGRSDAEKEIWRDVLGGMRKLKFQRMVRSDKVGTAANPKAAAAENGCRGKLEVGDMEMVTGKARNRGSGLHDL